MRRYKCRRQTRETDVRIDLNVDGSGRFRITTPLGFFNHLMESFTRHGMFDLKLRADGDLHVDQHHFVEDCGEALGQAFFGATSAGSNIRRSGCFAFPMDESLAVVAVDIAGRSYVQYHAEFRRRFCGDLDTDVMEDFFHGFSRGLAANVAIRIPCGRSDHHKLEAMFKAFGRALDMACGSGPDLRIRRLSVKGEVRS